MKIVREVSVIEVKRCYVISNLARPKKTAGPTPPSYSDTFWQMYERVEKKVSSLSESKLDQLISAWSSKRLSAYQSATWYVADMSPRELGIWRRAGQLPLAWTNRTLEDTAKRVTEAAASKRSYYGRQKNRAGRVILSILKTQVNTLQSKKYLYPIVFKGGTGTRGRKYLRHKTAYDIDDGCMRSIALTVNGSVSIRVYVGLPASQQTHQ